MSDLLISFHGPAFQVNTGDNLNNCTAAWASPGPPISSEVPLSVCTHGLSLVPVVTSRITGYAPEKELGIQDSYY